MENEERPKKWVTCCRRKNCPRVAVEGSTLWIKDDNGAQVKITLDQLDAIATTVKAIRATRDV